VNYGERILALQVGAAPLPRVDLTRVLSQRVYQALPRMKDFMTRQTPPALYF
jgi:hypothetical protein